MFNVFVSSSDNELQISDINVFLRMFRADKESQQIDSQRGTGWRRKQQIKPHTP